MEFAQHMPALISFAKVVLIDLTLAADNAIVIGMVAVGLPEKDRKRAILLGIAAATVLRIAFAAAAAVLLQIVGLLLAGGILLLWVAWKMWRELREAAAAPVGNLELAGGGGAPVPEDAPRKTLKQATLQIVLADVSMSLDNVLGVAGAARDHTWVLVLGLALSVMLMGLAASFIARLFGRWPWIAYLGLGVILVVALEMIRHGSSDVFPVLAQLVTP